MYIIKCSYMSQSFSSKKNRTIISFFIIDLSKCLHSDHPIFRLPFGVQNICLGTSPLSFSGSSCTIQFPSHPSIYSFNTLQKLISIIFCYEWTSEWMKILVAVVFVIMVIGLSCVLPCFLVVYILFIFVMLISHFLGDCNLQLCTRIH